MNRLSLAGVAVVLVAAIVFLARASSVLGGVLSRRRPLRT